MFRLRDKILGKKKVQPERVVLVNPETGKEVNTPSEIKEVSLTYLLNLLTKNTYQEKFMNYKLQKEQLHWERMEEVIENDQDEMTLEMFEKTLVMLSKKPGNKYKFILEAAVSFKGAMFNLFKTAWRTETFPAQWQDSNVIQLFKKAGSLKELNN